jgi:hypothetical protein
MKPDPYFSVVDLKINTAGSWCNAGRFSSDHYDEVKAHCLALSKAASGHLNFKLVDAAGGTLERLSAKNGELEWREV